MSDPVVKGLGAGWRLEWAEEGVVIEVPRIRVGRDGEVKAELKIANTREGFPPKLEHEDLNLKAGRSKAALAKQLKSKVDDLDWGAIINQCADLILDLYKTGEPARTLRWDDEEVGPTPMSIDPIAPLYMPTVFFGDGGTAKSLLVELLGITSQLPWYDNPLGLAVENTITETGDTQYVPRRVLYLDWEADWREISRRLKCLARGLHLEGEGLTLEYRRCALPLAEDIDYIQDLLITMECEHIILDSLGPASGGELDKSAPAIALYNAARSLRTCKGEPPTLFIIAHEPKNAEKKTIFGSVFFNNLARSVWHVKANPQGKRVVEQSLHHVKSNSFEMQEPIGFRWTFGAREAMTISVERTTDMASLLEHTTWLMRIHDALRATGQPMSAQALASATGAKQKLVTDTLGRAKKAGQATLTPEGLWNM